MRYAIAVLLICFSINSQAQEKKKKWGVGGYVRYMQTNYILDKNFDSTLTDNLIHNRINFQWYPNKNWLAKVEVRNRLFYGEVTKANPFFAQQIDQNNDFFDLSFFPIKTNSIYLHSMVDRAFLEFTKNKLEVRLGRQRINWGINMMWNPNDLFNNFSFFDFDYQERMGSDALRIQYYTGATSSVEFAIKAFDDVDEVVAGALWRGSKWNYDFQFLGGVAKKDLTIGGGWSGYVKDVSFNGEMSYFHPYENLSDTSGTLVATVGTGLLLKKDISVNGSILYNSTPATGGLFSLTNSSAISAKSLSPYEWTGIVALGYPINPLLNTSLALMYSPTNHAFLTSPTLAISLKDNLSMDIISQLYFLEDPLGNYNAAFKGVFFRLAWSY